MIEAEHDRSARETDDRHERRPDEKRESKPHSNPEAIATATRLAQHQHQSGPGDRDGSRQIAIAACAMPLGVSKVRNSPHQLAARIASAVLVVALHAMGEKHGDCAVGLSVSRPLAR